jgi:hypothetical protein
MARSMAATSHRQLGCRDGLIVAQTEPEIKCSGSIDGRHDAMLAANEDRDVKLAEFAMGADLVAVACNLLEISEAAG